MGSPQYVQGNYAVPQTAQTAVTAAYVSAQSAGDLNVVLVGWNSLNSHVTSVTDSKGNPYQLAFGPTAGNGVSQVVYYAKNIASASAGSNAVTVTFDTAAAYPDVRLLEYSGLDPVNPLDVAVGATGNRRRPCASLTRLS